MVGASRRAHLRERQAIATYFTSAGLQKLAQSESGGRADLVHYPSGYTRSGVKSSASGLYGYLDSTWQQEASKAGVDVSMYPRAYMAPADVQTAVAAQTPTSHWMCAGCNSVASGMAGNPQYVSYTPTATGSGASSDSGGYVTSDDPAFNPGGRTSSNNTATGAGSGYIWNPETGTYFNPDTGDVKPPGTPGLEPPGIGEGAPGDVRGAGKGLAAIATYASNWLIQIALIVLGIVLIAAAAWRLAEEKA